MWTEWLRFAPPAHSSGTLRDTLTLATAPRHWDPTSGDPSGLLLQPRCDMGKEQDRRAPGGMSPWACGIPRGNQKHTQNPKQAGEGQPGLHCIFPSCTEETQLAEEASPRNGASAYEWPLIAHRGEDPTGTRTRRGTPIDERAAKALPSFCPFAPLQRITRIPEFKIITVRNK